MDEVTIFDGDEPRFEQMCVENGFTHWSAKEFASILGYSDYQAFFKTAVNKAQQVLLSLQIDLSEHFKQNGDVLRMSRFACYLCAMNADIRKPAVQKAQAYFASLATACAEYLQEQSQVERILIRDDVSQREKGLNAAAKQAGVVEYGLFQNAGYRGLYGMNLKKLKEVKRLPNGKCLLDFMGKEELAANLFRITQTEAKLRNDGIKGQRNAEHTAEIVGREVRKTMDKLSGTRPENLPLETGIKDVKKALKITHKEMGKIDSVKRKKK